MTSIIDLPSESTYQTRWLSYPRSRAAWIMGTLSTLLSRQQFWWWGGRRYPKQLCEKRHDFRWRRLWLDFELRASTSIVWKISFHRRVICLQLSTHTSQNCSSETFRLHTDEKPILSSDEKASLGPSGVMIRFKDVGLLEFTADTREAKDVTAPSFKPCAVPWWVLGASKCFPQVHIS